MRRCSIFKMTGRSIRAFLGRYMALLLIVALSAGFFAGLKVTKDAMTNTGDLFLTEQKFYDFRMYSTLGFTKEDVEKFSDLPEVCVAEGTKTMDAMLYYGGKDLPFTLLALPEQANLPSLTAGRMPEAEYECLADDERFTEDDLGKTICLAGENEESVTKGLHNTEFTIVGLVDSPLYIGLDRGSTGIGSGVVYGFLYLPEENFAGGVYTEIDVVLSETAAIYSEEYDDIIEQAKDNITELCKELAEERYESLLAAHGLTPELGAQFGINAPETYVLTRSENAGYVNFKNDTAIVSGIANLFPIFFILIAMLVCMTTMTRMVDEERTQIGVLKALGYSNGAIMAKYLLYAGSATVIGWTIGFFLCTWGLPQIFWFAYNALYDFAPLSYLFSPLLAGITLLVSLLGILGSTFLSCRKELQSVPAKLIRPRTAKNGKRILLERLTFLWEHLSFLQKITLRNMFRYKRRLIMMLFGISCCAGLVVTGFGVRDSMTRIGSMQYEEVQNYDLEVSFAAGDEAEVLNCMKEVNGVQESIPASFHRVELMGEEVLNSVTLMSFRDKDRLSGFWDFHSGNEKLAYPEKGEALINTKAADRLGLSVGDRVTIRTTDMQSASVTVSGIFDNYIYNYILISEDTYTENFGEWEANKYLLSVDGDAEELSKALIQEEKITSVAQLSTTRENVESALECLDYIILMVVLFSGALAFVVIYNLTNINIAERSREIATVQVLGFYPKETESYVLRENLVLSIVASFIGLPLGVLFHRAVMSFISIDLLDYPLLIKPESYVMALICTVLFACVVNLFMKRQIAKIPMAESLKAVE
ncbi:MAG: FtsX-like permease family protein [Lachnospiraceae bacterium]|nr:FtsX-like permease family protein [Lachnospiraceae bacterium]